MGAGPKAGHARPPLGCPPSLLRHREGRGQPPTQLSPVCPRPPGPQEAPALWKAFSLGSAAPSAGRGCVQSQAHVCPPLQPGRSVNIDCQECTCDGNTRSLSCRRQPCPLPPTCLEPGFVPVPVAPQAGQCCPQYHCGEPRAGRTGAGLWLLSPCVLGVPHALHWLTAELLCL